jgi:ribonuclease P/MRP protein subunit RPP1
MVTEKFNSLRPDILRLRPDEKFLTAMGFDSCIFFTRDPSILEREPEDFIFPAYVIECSSVNELKKGLKTAKKEWIVGVLSSDTSVIREAISRKKVDMLLDPPKNSIDYTSMKLAAEKDVAVELSLSRFLKIKGLKRMRSFEYANDVIMAAKKHSTPLIFSSGATIEADMRPFRQLRDFFGFIGGDFQSSILNLRRIIRRYFDQDYLMDGLEILDQEFREH